MQSIKSYTDLEQSKKLAEILPIESADMHYNNGSCRGVNYTEHFSAKNTIALIETFEDYNKAPDMFGDAKFWLKSLRPQSNWKPSDEQMLAINTAINVLGKGTLNGKQLIGLQEQLKKLK